MAKMNSTRWVVLLFPGLWLCSHQAFSQRNFDFNYSNAQQFFADVNGRPLYMKVEYNIEGSPFYPERYYKANLFLQNGKAYTSIPVKMNLLDNTILYTTPDGEELVTTNPIERVVFTDTSDNNLMKGAVFERGYATVDKQDKGTYYEVVDSGKVMLLKYHRVSFDDKKYYASASITRVFKETASYYVCLENGTMKKLEKGQEALLALFTVKKEELRAYTERENLKCKKESDWKKVIAYYNSFL